jgi:sec-independent protein translocase protein TatB
MFDLAWSEIAVIGLVSVMVLGPKELPNAMRTMAKLMRKMRGLTSELQGHVNEMVREAELEELRQQVQKLSSTNIATEVTKAVDPTGEFSAALNAPMHTEPTPTSESSPETPAVEAGTPPPDEPSPTATASTPAGPPSAGPT